MSLRDPHFALTVFLEPVARYSVAAPIWPPLVEDLVGDVRPAAADPIDAVLRGPVPVRRLATRPVGPGLTALLTGLGDAVALSIVVVRPGELETGGLPLGELRAAAVSRLLAGSEEVDDEPSGEAPPADEALAAALTERLGEDPGWRLLGISEVSTVLAQGVAPDILSGAVETEVAGVRLLRAVGVGAGHVAWELRGHYMRDSEVPVVDRRLRVLREGYRERASAMVEYSGCALRWGRGVRRALRRAAALDEILDSVRVATSWAISGGPVAGGAEPDLRMLAARLEALRVGLVEEIEDLRALLPRLTSATARILGDVALAPWGGAFAEGGEEGERVVASLSGRETAAGRWSAALEQARRAHEGSAGG